MTARLKFIPIAVCALALAGCGLTGDLQRPEPLIGSPDDIDAARLPDREVERGLPDDFEGAGAIDEDDTDDDTPNAEDELLGGPGSR